MPPRRQATELEQLMAAQAQLTQVMTQFMEAQNNNNNNNGNNQPQGDALTRFLRLRPTKFSTATEPMVALDWLRSVNKDLVTVGCTDAENVRFAAHLLEGPAASWWDTFQITHPLDTVTWAMFEEGFRTNHVSSGVLSLKRKEFRNLRKTNCTVAEYIDEFNNLSRYAPEDVDTDAKRRERFLDGLSDELSVQLLVVYCPTFQELMDKAGILEGKHKQVESRKRKSNNHHSGSDHKSRTSYDGYSKHGGSDHGSHDRHHHGGDGHRHDNHRSNHHSHKGGHSHHSRGHGGHDRNRDRSFVKKDLSEVTCFKCKQKGHYADNCPERKGLKPTNGEKATVNHMNVEEIPDDPDLVIGKFPINTYPAIILFDTGASHSFISRAFVDKYKLPTESMKRSIRVSSPGGDMIASAGCRDLTVRVGTHNFIAHLVVLDSQGLDVILGMDWMSMHGEHIDCAQRAVSLKTPDGKRIRFKSVARPRRCKLNSLKGVSMDTVPVIRDYPDVFPEELPGMPPDRDVEFLIDLMPGTGPIAKKPYKMDVDELKELKKQLKE